MLLLRCEEEHLGSEGAGGGEDGLLVGRVEHGGRASFSVQGRPSCDGEKDTYIE